MESLYLKTYDVNINSGDLIGIIGPNSCGKTELLNKIMGRISNNEVFIDNKLLNDFDISYKRNNIVCVFDDNLYNTSNVLGELKYFLIKLNKNYDESISDFINYFSLENLLNENFVNMCVEDRIFIKILSLLIIKPLIICIDDLLTYLSIEKKMKILNYIKENKITLLNVTSEAEELLLMDKIFVLNKGKKVVFDDVSVILENEELFKENGLSLPFIKEINNLLRSYDLISDSCVTYKELVNILWK